MDTYLAQRLRQDMDALMSAYEDDDAVVDMAVSQRAQRALTRERAKVEAERAKEQADG